MAALSDTSAPDICELRQLPAARLNPLLEEECKLWEQCLDWDFRSSADSVRRFVQMKALNGFALTVGQDVVGYCYYVCEETKGLVGDLYVRHHYQCQEYEHQLLEASLRAMAQTHRVRRVEAQLMLLSSSLERVPPFPSRLRVHPRQFMVVPLSGVEALPVIDVGNEIRIEPWRRQIQERAAQLIAEAYHGHIDSQINDQYRSVAGARRFLLNIVQYPGCGSFHDDGSLIAFSRGSEVCGLCLASLVSSDVGHITQICVSPNERGRGIGYELLRRSLCNLAAAGCRKVSLTVTASNQSAVQLYESMGFVTLRVFGAYVWEGFR